MEVEQEKEHETNGRNLRNFWMLGVGQGGAGKFKFLDSRMSEVEADRDTSEAEMWQVVSEPRVHSLT